MNSLDRSPLGITPAVLAGSAAAWLAAVAWASQSGTLVALNQAFVPALGLLMTPAVVVPAALCFALPSVRRAVDALGLRRITMLHMARIPGSMLFFYYGVRGELPLSFWLATGIGDFVAGCLAVWLTVRDGSRRQYRFMHVWGAVDLSLAMAQGLVFTLLLDPRMQLLTTMPMAAVNLWWVGLLFWSHLIVLARLTAQGARS